ncbi:hypothetical protein FK004_05185 [Flavobacterium kingsejongi]|uniref:Uncharacterized protein n=1 Tax=Flavobacterium kingsejongi TaxID=1678728 RepID=A0A2S1LLS9_9FLAO|nr:hypothetical protein FK004_05185 [Flavobacterium kingsejongi]
MRSERDGLFQDAVFPLSAVSFITDSTEFTFRYKKDTAAHRGYGKIHFCSGRKGKKRKDLSGDNGIF